MLTRSQHGWIGIDLGGSSVKAAQMVRRGSRWQLAAACVVDRAEAWPLTNLASEPARSSRGELDKLRAAGHFSGRAAATTLPLAATPYTTVAHSGQRDRELGALVAAELEQFSLASADMLYDTWPASDTADAEKSASPRTNVLAITETWADAVADDVLRTGWQCQALDGLPLAIARAVHWSAGTHRDEAIAAVDLGGTSASLTVVRRGVPLYVRTLKFAGFDPLVASVAETLECSPREAESVLRSHGLAAPGTVPSDVNELLADLAEPTLRDLCSELQRTLQFVASSKAKLTATRVVLLGGGAQLAGIATVVARRIEKPTKVWQLPGFVTRAAGLQPSDDPRFATAIALSQLAWKADALLGEAA